MVIENTLFEKRDIHKCIWVRQDNEKVVNRAMMDSVVLLRM